MGRLRPVLFRAVKPANRTFDKLTNGLINGAYPKSSRAAIGTG